MSGVIALHGFLGLAGDWQFAEPDVDGLEARDLWGEAHLDFVSWAHNFNSGVVGKPLLIGYSMGGRLAMHAALLNPEKFSGVILVSAHPGLDDQAEREKRIVSDHVWAARFAENPWAEVLAQWNAQSVLQSPSGEPPLQRSERDFDRTKLARAMDQWSLGRQRDLRSQLEALEVPVLFMSGESDAKFTQLTKSLKLGARQERLAVLGAGHRVPWDQPQEFVKAVNEFRRKL